MSERSEPAEQRGSGRVSEPRRQGPLYTRVVASLVGSYVFVWGFVTLGIPLGVAGGMPFEDARTLLYLLAFLVYVACFCWAFAAASAARIWACFLGGGALMTLAGWALARSLV